MNYIIASYGGPIPNRIYDEKAEFFLMFNLKCLFSLLKKNKETLIKQVTIVCPPVKENPYKYYYNKEKWIEKFKAIPYVKLVYLDYEGENIHASYDQWIQAYLAFPNFDYYILCEDDYTINPDLKNFDSELLRIYKEKFPTNIGYLCSRAGKNIFPYHAMISNGIISKETFLKVPLKNNDLLYTFYNTPCPGSRVEVAQLQFSNMFYFNDIPVLDYTDYYAVKYHNSDLQIIIDYSTKIGLNHLFIPIQILPKPAILDFEESIELSCEEILQK